MKRSILITLAVASVLIQSTALAYDDNTEGEADDPWSDAIVADRPDVAETSLTVGKLRFQIETSFEFTQDIEAGITTRRYSFPTLFRFGIIDPLELRLEGEWFIVETESGQPTHKGFSDVAFGLKAHVLDAGPKGIPSLGLLAMVLAPTGKAELSANAWIPVFKVLADWDMVYNLSLGVNVGVDVPERDAAGDKYAQFIYAVSFGYLIHGLDDRLRTFVEVAGIVPLKSNKDVITLLNAGLAYLLTPNMQIDGFVRVGLNAASPDTQGGIGYAVRF